MTVVNDLLYDQLDEFSNIVIELEASKITEEEYSDSLENLINTQISLIKYIVKNESLP